MTEPHPVLFAGSGFTLYSHGLFFALGALAAALFFWWGALKKRYPAERATLNALLIFGFGLAGARLGYFLTYPSEFTSLGRLLSIWEGGLVSYWGIAAGLLAAVAVLRQERGASLAQWLDLVALAALLGWSIGRIGNFLAGDSVGVPSAFWDVTYGRVPIQLAEALWCLGWGLALTRTWLRGRAKDGPLLATALASYLVGRVLIDGWRDEEELAGLQVSQWVGLLGAALTVAVAVKLRLWVRR